MANFDDAFKITMGHEGGYSFDPDDAGGETYRGVARRYHPQWHGWRVIDAIRDGNPDADDRDMGILIGDETIMDSHVRDLYKEIYWDAFLGDDILKEAVAIEMFDTGVNMGVGRAVKFLQRSLNLLNRNGGNSGAGWPDIVEDGGMGPQTLKTLSHALSTMGDKDDYIVKLMNIMQGQHYIEYMVKSPTQEKYARGWLNRVSITKDSP